MATEGQRRCNLPTGVNFAFAKGSPDIPVPLGNVQASKHAVHLPEQNQVTPERLTGNDIDTPAKLTGQPLQIAAFQANRFTRRGSCAANIQTIQQNSAGQLLPLIRINDERNDGHYWYPH